MNPNKLRAARLARFGSPAVEGMDDTAPVAAQNPLSEYRNQFFGPRFVGNKSFATTSTSSLDNIYDGSRKRNKPSLGGKRRTRRTKRRHRRTKGRRLTCRCKCRC